MAEIIGVLNKSKLGVETMRLRRTLARILEQSLTGCLELRGFSPPKQLEGTYLSGPHPVEFQCNEERSPLGRVVIALERLGVRLEFEAAMSRFLTNFRLFSGLR